MRYVFRTSYLRNIFIISLIIALGLPTFVLFIIYPSFKELLTKNTEDQAERVAKHLTYMVIQDRNKIEAEFPSEETQHTLQQVIENFRLMNLKIFSSSGKALYSAVDQDIGKINKNNYFHEIEARGRIFTKVVIKDTRSAEGQIFKADVVETYVPIMKNDVFFGAFEIYYDITERKKILDKLLLASAGILSFVSLSLLFAITIILTKAGKNIIEREKAEKEKRGLQDRLSRSQKMEAMGLLAGGVAHDLNNVLSGLVSYPDLILLDLPEGSPIKKPILTMQDSGKKAAAIVQDLLTLARRGVANTKVLEINKIFSDYFRSPEFEKLQSFHPGVHIETDFETDLLNIKGSEIHLKKAIMNLISNAAEAMPGGGEIMVSTGNQYVDRPIDGYQNISEGEYALIKVKDRGIGISKDDIEKVFEPFYTKKTMGRSGTGLGMAVVWGTVQDHHGYINIKSVEGEGTTFELYFPVTREAVVKESETMAIDRIMGNGEKILVVDDVKEQREIADGILSKLNYRVTTVSNGEKAFEYMKNHSADLLVLDMIMPPGIDGLDTYRKILETHPKQKAVIASGFSETDRVKETQKLGAGQYIRKPYTLEKIGVAVRDELKEDDA
jgi:signal transduction histidine kinase/ActR/RegA family two-component response regulator